MLLLGPTSSRAEWEEGPAPRRPGLGGLHRAAPPLRSGASWAFPEAPWLLCAGRLPHWLVLPWPGLLPGLCPQHPSSLSSVGRNARWSSRWLLPSPGKEAGERQAALDSGLGLEGEASCCGRSEASPSPPVPFPGLLSPWACPCGVLARRAASRGKWPSSECSSSPWATAQLRPGLSPAPCGHLPVTPYPSREMLSHG